MISIGIVAEDGREYYAISNEFNTKKAWNRYDLRQKMVCDGAPEAYKEYWVRDNVLRPIFDELVIVEKEHLKYSQNGYVLVGLSLPFTYKEFKKLINKYGKTNKQIAEEVYNFCSNDYHKGNNLSLKQRVTYDLYDKFKPEFYGYYSAYDHVALCWLFGKMIDLPNGFPMYTIDLKQILDEKAKLIPTSYTTEEGLKSIKISEDYPQQPNKHNALSDAKWNFELYKFLNRL